MFSEISSRMCACVFMVLLIISLNVFRNLNLDACLWEFVSYFDMSELTTECGGTINTDGQVMVADQDIQSKWKILAAY